MDPSILPRLRAPADGASLAIAHAETDTDGRITRGWLVATASGVAYPVLRGFAAFDEPQAELPERPKRVLGELDDRLFGSPEAFADFVHLKARRPAFDAYAAWQPWNEASRAIDPLWDALAEVVHEGAVIVDLWCRTGWSAELLAGRFPHARIVAIVEGGRDVLGHRGVAYWLGEGRRAPNLDIVFADPHGPLPFSDGTAALVHGFDVLHGGEHDALVAEALRVCTPDGAIVFPHVHLANAEPDPWFDRGGSIRHGREYRRYFDHRLAGSPRRAWVLSEAAMLERAVRGGGVLADEHDTQHYNACILIGPQRWEGRPLGSIELPDAVHARARAIPHPLVRVDLATGRCTLDGGRLDGQAEWLLQRHGVSARHLERTLPVTLDVDDREVLFFARSGRTVAEIAARLRRSEAAIVTALRRLRAAELVRLEPVSWSMAALQAYYATQAPPREPAACTLGQLFAEAEARHGARTYLAWPADGSAFSYADTAAIARRGAAVLRERGVAPGDAVVVEALGRPELAIALWAIVLAGGVVVPLDPSLGPDRFRALVDRVRARVAIVGTRDRDPGVPALGFGAAADTGIEDFVTAIAAASPVTTAVARDPDGPAAILFTSGSTGAPKGVALSHRSLVSSSALVDRLYGLRKEDRMLMAGGFHTMSGLRNPLLVPLHAGATTVLPPCEQRASPLSTIEQVVAEQVTVLSTVPAFVTYAVRAGDRVAGLLRGSRLRALLCTGAALQPEEAARFRASFGIPVHDYYGLTETGGVCIARDEREDAEGLGRPREALVVLRDDRGRPIDEGETGEITVCSDQLMLGYWGDPERTRAMLRDGWVYTGDRGRVTRSGNVLWLGRRDRLIVDRDGENLQPEEIERVLEGSGEVGGAWVLSCDDGRGVERIVAAVEVQDEDGERWDRLAARLRERLSARHVPARFVALARLPRTSAGKIDDDAVREAIARALATESER